MDNSANIKSHVSPPATLTLQWLAYAFWGWLGISLIWLSAVTFSFFIEGNQLHADITESIAYPLAAVIVLGVIAGICDIFYARREATPKKTGMESVIMIIHAVIFALLAIGSTIVAVFALINMLISTGSANESWPKIALFTALVVAVFYIALALRIALVGHTRHIRIAAWSVMLAISVGMIATSIAGPTAFLIHTKQDRLIENGIGPLSASINQYANQNNKLPETLSSLSLDNSDAQKIIAGGLVTYKPDAKPTEIVNQSIYYGIDKLPAPVYPDQDTNTTKRFFYELCVNYKAERNVGSTTFYGKESTDDEYASYISGYDKHGKGDYCYKASTYVYGKY